MSSIAERGTLAQPAPDARASIRTRARIIDLIMTIILWILASALALGLGAALIYLITLGLGTLNWQFLTSGPEANGIGAAFFNTFYIILLSLILCVPLAICAAIYLVEYAKQGPFVTAVRFAVETLAGIPSILLGLFGYLIFVTAFGYGTPACAFIPGTTHALFCYHGLGLSRLAGALTLTILNLPLMVRISEDALRSVSNDLREASFGLGASKVQTVLRVMIPTGLAQLTTGVVLTTGKMMGETAALLFTTGGNSPISGWRTLNPLVPGDVLTVHLYELRAEGVVRNATQLANSTATVLILLLLVFNLGLRYLSGLLNRRLAGRRS